GIRDDLVTGVQTCALPISSGAVDFNVNNPVPVLASIAPASKLTGDDAFTLTVTGTNFVNGAVLRLNSSDRATTFVDATQLTAQRSEERRVGNEWRARRR